MIKKIKMLILPVLLSAAVLPVHAETSTVQIPVTKIQPEGPGLNCLDEWFKCIFPHIYTFFSVLLFEAYMIWI